MKRLCARAAPGNGWDRRWRAPRAEHLENATPVQASTGTGVILSRWAWRAYQRARIAPDLLVATGEAANG